MWESVKWTYKLQYICMHRLIRKHKDEQTDHIILPTEAGKQKRHCLESTERWLCEVHLLPFNSVNIILTCQVDRTSRIGQFQHNKQWNYNKLTMVTVKPPPQVAVRHVWVNHYTEAETTCGQTQRTYEVGRVAMTDLWNITMNSNYITSTYLL